MIKKKKSSLIAIKSKKEFSSPVLRELKIIKTEIRDLKDENMLTKSRIRVLQNQLKDESSLIREQNLEFKDEILNEIKAMREEYTERITSLKQPKFS